jgi:hypothetical protein
MHWRWLERPKCWREIASQATVNLAMRDDDDDSEVPARSLPRRAKRIEVLRHAGKLRFTADGSR